MRRRRIRASASTLDRIRRAIKLAEASDYLGLRRPEVFGSKLDEEVYTRTRDNLERLRAEAFPGGQASARHES